MDDLVLVHVLQTYQDIGDEKLRFLLVEVSFISQMVAKITAIQVVHDEVEVLSILESRCHINQKGMVQFA